MIPHSKQFVKFVICAEKNPEHQFKMK